MSLPTVSESRYRLVRATQAYVQSFRRLTPQQQKLFINGQAMAFAEWADGLMTDLLLGISNGGGGNWSASLYVDTPLSVAAFDGTGDATSIPISDFATQADLTGYAQLSDLTNYALQSELANYALLTDLSAYALQTDLAAYATIASLSAYALTTDLDSYALLTDLDAYALDTDLANYVLTTTFTTTIANYTPTAGLSAVALDNDYNSLDNLPAIPADLEDLADVSGSPSVGQVLTYTGPSTWEPQDLPTNPATPDTNARRIIGFRLLFDSALTSSHVTFNRDPIDDSLTGVDVWETAAELVKLFTRTLTYNVGGDVTQIQTVNESTGEILTSVFAYSGEDIVSITNTIT